MRVAILALLAEIAIRLLRLTWRVKLLGPVPGASGAPLIFCFWHGRQAGLFAYPRKRKVAVIASLSRDGEIQAAILRRLGFSICRGSSSRGGARALKAMVDRVAGGEDAAFAVDGPRGPAFTVKQGAVLVAKKTNGLLVPVTVSASRYWRFKKTWDDYCLPKPFSIVNIVINPAIEPYSLSVNALCSLIETSLKKSCADVS